MKVKDLMTKKVITVRPKTPSSEVAKIILEKKISGLPVLDKKKVVGVISEKDLLISIFPSMTDLIYHPKMKEWRSIEQKIKTISKMKVSDLMSKPPIVIQEDKEVAEAMAKMILSRIQRLPVLDEKGRLVGIITRGDIFKNLLKK